MRRVALGRARSPALAACCIADPGVRAAGGAGAGDLSARRRRRRRAPAPRPPPTSTGSASSPTRACSALIELALANNRDLRVAVLNIEQARALYQVRRADELPTVGVGGSAQRAAGEQRQRRQRLHRRLRGHRLRARPVRPRPQPERGGAGPVPRDRGGAQGGADQPDRSVANTYLTLLADDEQLRVTRQTLATREESTRLTKLRFDNGASSELDFRQAESLLEGARAALAQSLRQRALDENALQLLVGQPLPADLPAPLPLDDAADRRPTCRPACRRSC